MGVGINVSCQCFGTFTLQIGPRMAPPKYCLFPFLCTGCKSVSTLDIYAQSLECGHCGSRSVVPYGDRQAVGGLGSTVVFACPAHDTFSAEQLTLTDGTYWCPTCHQYTARFTDAGILWD
jgi:hypothetical protein